MTQDIQPTILQATPEPAPIITHDEETGAFSLTIDPLTRGRIDKVLSTYIPDISRGRIKSLIEDGHVVLNKAVCTNASRKIQTGDVLELIVPEPTEWYPEPENIPLDIVFEDDDVVVINKQAGLVVHPGAGNKDGTLVNALLYHCGDTLSGIGGVLRPGIVHRLDKDTTGLMVIAKNDKAHQGLSSQFADRTLSRKYKALVLNSLMPLKGTVDKPLGRHKNHRIKMAINEDAGKEARTHYKAIDIYPSLKNGALSLVECTLESGRTHQIRVHMESIGYPLIGDKLYNAQPTAVSSRMKKVGYNDNVIEKVLNFPRQALHAFSLTFEHPTTKEIVAFSIDLAPDMQDLVDLLQPTE